VKSTRRDPLRELQQLLRAPEDGACNLGAFLAEHADALADALGSTADDLRASVEMPDEVIAPRLRVRLARRREIADGQKALDDAQVALHAATTLGHTVRWTERGAVLDTDLLLGDVLADGDKKYVVFHGPDFTTAIDRGTLARTRALRRLFVDVAAYVDAGGLYFRWRGGRGGFNWKAQVVPPADRPRVLTIELAARAAVTRPAAWFTDWLREVGYAI
jgi:hypothetical protein